MNVIKKIRVALELIIFFVIDFLVAVVQIASWVFRPTKDLHPVIVRMPTILENKIALWILSLIIFLIPGSLVVDLSADSKILYIHVFHAPDPEAFLKVLKEKFERRLQFLFS